VTWVQKYGVVYRMWQGRNPLINISSPSEVEVGLFIPYTYYYLEALIVVIYNLKLPDYSRQSAKY
jgi:hypothetical protein